MKREVIISVSILLVISVLFAGCIQLFSGNETKENLYLFPVSDAPSEVMAALDHFSESVYARCNELDVELTRAAADLSGIPRTDTTSISDVLMKMYSNHPYAVGISRVGPNGEEYASLPMYSLTGMEMTSSFWEFDETSFAKNNATILMEPLYSTTYGEILHFRHPVYTPEGTYDGWVGVSFVMTYIVDTSEDYFSYGHANNYFPALYDAEGNILYYPTQEIIGDNIQSLSREDSEVLLHTDAIFTQSDGMMKYLFTPFNPGPLVEYTTVWKTITVCGRDLNPNIIMYEVEDWNQNFSEDLAIDDLSNLVFRMYQYGKANGMNATTAEIQNQRGKFAIDPNIILFAYDMNATTLASSLTPDRIGKNQMNAGDAYGLRYISRMVDLCEQGGGFVHYYKPVGEPSGSVSVLMISYVLPVNREWFVGAAYPIMFASPDPKKRDELNTLVVAAQQYVRDQGKDAALFAFSAANSSFQLKDVSLMSMDYDGNVLSAPIQLNVTGKNAFGFTNAHGVSSMRELVILAKQGGNYLLMDTASPNGMNTMYLFYVEPVSNEWCLISWTELNTFVEGR